MDKRRRGYSSARPGSAGSCPRRVDPETWNAYWMIAIEDRPVREVAGFLGKKYTAVYNGYKRVDRMLRLEGQRRLADLMIAAEGD